MRFVDFIVLLDSDVKPIDVKPINVKLHLATWNGNENSLDVYLEGKF